MKQYSGKKLQLNLLRGKIFLKKFNKRGDSDKKGGVRQKSQKINKQGARLFGTRQYIN